VSGLTPRKGIGIFVFALFIVVLAVAWILPINYIYTPPTLSLPVSVYGGTSLSTYPSVNYAANMLFTASGSFSVGNTVHIRIEIYDVNNTGAIESSTSAIANGTNGGKYCCASITDALNIPPIRGTGSSSGDVFSDRIPLKYYSENDTFIGSDDIEFAQPGNQTMSLLPPANLTKPQFIIMGPSNISKLKYPYNLT
jgi:hypothetical protein